MRDLRLFMSNRLEVLAESLVQVLKKPLKSPLSKEIVVVQSRGMERWLNLYIASRIGICANTKFLFPNAFLYEAMKALLSKLPERSPYETDILAFRIMKLLPRLIEDPETSAYFSHHESYIRNVHGNRGLVQLSSAIARCFDAYQVYRPEMLFQWDKGESDDWQAILWRSLRSENPTPHRAELGRQILEKMGNEKNLAEIFPERVSVIGISVLPEFHVEFFTRLSAHIPVHLFIMNPCREYWGDQLSEKEKDHLLRKAGALKKKTDHLEEMLFPEEGNALLSSLGKTGRHFFDTLYEKGADPIPLFSESTDGTLLSAIQNDILRMDEPFLRSGTKKRISKNDNSIRIHSCHGPMREMEILRDVLLDFFENDPDLNPSDVLVMAPEIDTYSPFIQAVFAPRPDSPVNIPFTIADRGVRMENRIADVFLDILELYGSRFSAAQILRILEVPVIRRRFDLSEADFGTLREWVRTSGIRWGIDAENREELGISGLLDNTWKSGIDRLLLGYAMPGGLEGTFSGIFAQDGVEGSDAILLGRMVAFTSSLFGLMKTFKTPRTIKDWVKIFGDVLTDFFDIEGEGGEEILSIRRVLAELLEISAMSGMDQPLDIRTVCDLLSDMLEKRGLGSGFLGGGVTFCAMLPMRSIPFQVICLLGMQIEDFPRHDSPQGFDFMARHPKPGDPSKRFDDRYLFLETILSARKKLHISYVGHNIRDNSEKPPAVPVSELVDYILRNYETGDTPELSGVLRISHRLHGFSPEYFRPESGLFSYSRKNFETAKTILSPRKEMPPFFSETLSCRENDLLRIDFRDLIHFFKNPSEYLLKNRLNVVFRDSEAPPEESEPFVQNHLETYNFAQECLDEILQGGIRDEQWDLFLEWKRACGEYPLGRVGTDMFTEFRREVVRFAEIISPYFKKPKRDPVMVKIRIDDMELMGMLSGLYADGILRYRFAKVKPKDRIETWIHHLVLSVLIDQGKMDTGANRSVFFGKDKTIRYQKVTDAMDALRKLLSLYRKGLGTPLPFFPQTSWTYAEKRNGKKPERAEWEARKAWNGDGYREGEKADPYFSICFRENDVIDDDFKNISDMVFKPILEWGEEENT